MNMTQFVMAGVVALVIILPAMILLNPPTAWVDKIYGTGGKKKGDPK
jgi:hypothetical protein